MGVLFEFWAKVTPSILQLVSHSKHKDSNDFTQNSNAKVIWKFVQIDEMHRNLNVYVYFQLSEMVNLHFLSLLEALKETNSTILSKLLPLWSPVLSSHTQVNLMLIFIFFIYRSTIELISREFCEKSRIA